MSLQPTISRSNINRYQFVSVIWHACAYPTSHAKIESEKEYEPGMQNGMVGTTMYATHSPTHMPNKILLSIMLTAMCCYPPTLCAMFSMVAIITQRCTTTLIIQRLPLSSCIYRVLLLLLLLLLSLFFHLSQASCNDFHLIKVELEHRRKMITPHMIHCQLRLRSG